MTARPAKADVIAWIKARGIPRGSFGYLTHVGVLAYNRAHPDQPWEEFFSRSPEQLADARRRGGLANRGQDPNA